MLVVAALGGNALLQRGERLDADVQLANARMAAEALAGVAATNRLVITHGNGPQVGLLALQNEACTSSAPYPLDVLDAETEGMLGYVLEQQLGAHLPPERLASLLTQVVVDQADPAFDRPTKPIGPLYEEPEARRRAREQGWSIAWDGHGWRRVVASPEPQRIVELAAIRLLVDAGVTVVCVGGGGIPVVETDRGLRGIEAVIDKDLSAALLARELGADALLLLTDVDGVYDGFGTPEARRIARATPDDLRTLSLPAGSMGPKVEAVCRFVESGGRLGAIGSLADADALLGGDAGTIVARNDLRPWVATSGFRMLEPKTDSRTGGTS
jgi:carbamate kinase